MCVCLVVQSGLTLCDPIDCSLPGSSVYGIFQARILEWVTMSFSTGSWQPTSPALAGGILYHWTTWEAKQEWKQKSKTNSSVQFSSVAQLCPTLCNPMNRSTPGLPVHHQLPEFTQTHVHRVGDAIQPSQPLLSPSPPVPNPSQHQSLFQWVNSFHELAKVLEFQL